MPELVDVTPGSPERHVLRLVRYPGYEAVLTIDGVPQHIAHLKVTPDVTTITYEADHA